ncbi:hypothetical protein VCHC21A1_1359, partial [Vibrio cholerae HC-21A1]
MLRATSATAAF